MKEDLPKMCSKQNERVTSSTKGDEHNGQKSRYCRFSGGGKRRKAKRGDREGDNGRTLKGISKDPVDEGSEEGRGYRDVTNGLSSAFPLFCLRLNLWRVK